MTEDQIDCVAKMSNKFLGINRRRKTSPNSNLGIFGQNQIKLLPDTNLLSLEIERNSAENNIPNFLFTFLCCAGLVQVSQKRARQCKTWLFVNFLLILGTVDFFVVMVTNHIFVYKTTVTLFLTLVLTLVICFLMRRTRRRMRVLLLKLQYLPPSTEERIFNVLAPFIFFLQVVSATTITIVCDKKISSTMFAYGNELKSQWAQIILIFLKEYSFLFTYQVYPCLIAIVYCTICVRCSNSVRNLTRKIYVCSPEQFGPSEQIQVLHYKTKIDEVLKITQEIFSAPSFCLIVSNSISCYSMLGSYLMDTMMMHQLIQASFIGICSFLYLTGILWISGTLPVELNKLRDTFYEKAYLRCISFGFSSEPNFRREILDKREFVFTGCDVLHYRRSSVLAVVGTLITYTLLVVNIP
ncbi:uncharacterized protein TNCT_50301 [Trichonephila clavata]|uniref:Gustatory receptor n=1 Tax=Trichonephila clavata TaxID=2740835 RepID=A0A8X6KPW6_TRICU|nr:uncharacterized protein TNCT_50301 [Trichonephila clavata]